MQFSATEAAAKPPYPDLTPEAVPVISFLHSEFQVVRSHGRYRLFSGSPDFVCPDRPAFALVSGAKNGCCAAGKTLPSDALRLTANEMSEFSTSKKNLGTREGYFPEPRATQCRVADVRPA